MRATPLIAAFLAVFMLSSVIALADTPVKQVALQGRLSDPTGKPLDGSFSVKFEIFASETEGATGTGLWRETQKVTVTKGLFGVNLGSVTQGGIPLAFDKPYWVEVSIGSEKLIPRYPLTSAPYSFYSGVPGLDASKIISGTFATDRIPGLTADKIPGLDAAKIISGTLSSARIPALTAAQIPALDAAKIATGVLSTDRIPVLNARQNIASGTITEPLIDHNAGLSAEILMHGMLIPNRVPPLYKEGWTAEGAGRIDASFIGTGTYNNWVAGMPASMITGTLDSARIPGLDAGKITTGTLAAALIPGLDAAKITTGTFGTARLTDNAVTSAKIADGTITSADIQNDAITTDDIKDHSIQGPDIIAGTIGSGELMSGAVTAAKISNGAVTSAKLAKRYMGGSFLTTPGAVDCYYAYDSAITDVSTPASCACSVVSTSDNTHPYFKYFCNCFVESVTGGVNIKLCPRYHDGSQIGSSLSIGIHYVVMEQT